MRVFLENFCTEDRAWFLHTPWSDHVSCWAKRSIPAFETLNYWDFSSPSAPQDDGLDDAFNNLLRHNIQRLLDHIVKCRKRLGAGLISGLGDNQLGKLRSNINVGAFKAAAAQCSPAARSRDADSG